MELIRSEVTPHFKWEQFKHNGDQVGHCTNSRGAKVVTRMTSSFTQSMDHYYYAGGPGMKEYRRNGDRIKDFHSNGNVEFTGGRIEELANKPNMNVFNQAVKDMKKTNIHKRIKTAFADTSVRKRRMNPHDGEYDHDRRWDVNPFSRAARGISPVRSLKIFANISFSGGVSPDTIDRYGAMMAAICNLLESSGITVEIILQSCHVDSLGDNDYFIDQVIVKKPGDYLPASSLIKAFSSNYYRRIMFTRTATNVELQEKTCKYGLATPANFDDAVSYSKGELHIFSHSILDKSKEVEFLDNLEKALGLKPSDKKDLKKSIEDYVVKSERIPIPRFGGRDGAKASPDFDFDDDYRRIKEKFDFFEPEKPFYDRNKKAQPKKKKGGYKAPF